MDGNRKTEIKKLTTEYMHRQEEMEEKRSRRMKGLKRRLSVFGAFMLLFVIIVSVTLYQQHSAIQDSERENQLLQEELEELQAEGSSLEEEIELLHDPEYIAELARRDFFLSKPGETLFQLPRSQMNDD
ncbi:septum formation initiator family protein [Bacillus daqingensis]|uniref:Septum formation initiator family protein n=1 Tax=Bacillus daqingensis TaxID=872396 RepID=A0ABV9P1R2_9BACI